MTDRELIELAAKAAGIGDCWRSVDNDYYLVNRGMIFTWNPLTDDGEALRLAVNLNLLVDCFGLCVRPLPDSIGWFDGYPEKDSNAAMRRAIVRAAAEIGKAMNEKANQ